MLLEARKEKLQWEKIASQTTENGPWKNIYYQTELVPTTYTELDCVYILHNANSFPENAKSQPGMTPTIFFQVRGGYF